MAGECFTGRVLVCGIRSGSFLAGEGIIVVLHWKGMSGKAGEDRILERSENLY